MKDFYNLSFQNKSDFFWLLATLIALVVGNNFYTDVRSKECTTTVAMQELQND